MLQRKTKPDNNWLKKKKRLPTPSVRNPKCPHCGEVVDTRSDFETESEEIAKYQDRIDYFCTECNNWVGVKVDYYGPAPVQIGPGQWEMH